MAGRRPLLLFFLLPAVLYVAAWRIIPALYTVYLSFTTYNLAYNPSMRWMGADNYIRLAHEGGLLSSFTLTVVFTIAVTCVELLLGLCTALLFDRRLPARNLLLGIFLIPIVLPPVVVGTIWYILFNQLVGPIPYITRILGGPNIPWLSTPTTALIGLIVSDVWEWTPLMTLLLLSALQAVPGEIIEAAKVDGASGLKLFRFITLPQIAGMIMVATGLRFMDAFRELDKVIIMTGGGPGTATDLISMHIYKAAFKFYSLGYAAAMVVVALAFLGLIYSLYLRALREVVVAHG